MDIYNLIKDIPEWVPFGLIGLTVAGMTAQTAVNVYRGTKKVNSEFYQFQGTYRDDFSKDELIAFYKKVKSLRPSLMGAKNKTNNKMIKDLEKQIMAYATQEMKEAIDNGAVLPFSGSIKEYSETYRKAIE